MCSGVVLEEEGVTLLRAKKDGDCVADPRPEEESGCGVGGVCGIGGAFCMIDSLFSLRASVGLIVRAPSPVACAGMTDRRLAAADGVLVLLSAERPGDRVVLRDDEPL